MNNLKRFLHLLVLTTLFLSLPCAVIQAGWVEMSDAPRMSESVFHMFELELADNLKCNLDIDGQITSADAVIALQMAVRGEHNDDVDMGGDGGLRQLMRS